MNDFETSPEIKEAIRARLNEGVVVLYSLPIARESIVLRCVTAKGREPEEGDCFNVEFRDAKTNELLEVLEEEGARRFKSSTIMSVMDELAEDYLRTSATRWEMYVNQSGRCSPDEISRGAATSGNVEQVVIRGLPR
jgi:phage terminase small subunit